ILACQLREFDLHGFSLFGIGAGPAQ
ncbi:MAG: hypothetical protein JWP80_4252, partial [Pseudomonas sp.]|nr:hypothetical protein [Pseudomonas sp.]